MKRPALKLNRIIPALVVAVMSLNTAAIAAEPQLVMFCSSWNMKCRDAKKVFSNASSDLNLKFSEYDIDDASTPQDVAKMGLITPSGIPYYYLIGPKGNILQEGIYRGESLQSFEQKLRSKLGK
jgi:thiol-disulfide isomerase/thioredoxin